MLSCKVLSLWALLASPHRLLTCSSQVPEDFFHVYRFNFGLFVSPDIMPYESKQAFWRLFSIAFWHISNLVSEYQSLSVLQFLIRLFIMKLLISNYLPPCFPGPLTFCTEFSTSCFCPQTQCVIESVSSDFSVFLPLVKFLLWNFSCWHHFTWQNLTTLLEGFCICAFSLAM